MQYYPTLNFYLRAMSTRIVFYRGNINTEINCRETHYTPDYETLLEANQAFRGNT